jgi:hypothetical protein
MFDGGVDEDPSDPALKRSFRPEPVQVAEHFYKAFL